ncbi:MAG TPA: dTDP-glucose 4,6-dehydratase [Syntrophomonadaceae bacterium]|nr:dTDP-glucose 4,6-dehydratase [Syntrophomonadaceae bacterium]
MDGENSRPVSILVTGGAGFIGSNFIPYFIEKHPGYRVINLDNLSYAGNLDNLREVENHPRYKFILGDIGNRELLEDLFREYDLRGVIHFAAESHVDNSINGPDVFIKTNINGTFTLLDVARRYWMDGPHQCRAGYDASRFHHISTDEVYGSLGESGLFSEDSPYAPNSPYSASKASSDFIVRCYYHTYGMNVVTSNCSNNYGPKQHDEKLIPTIIRKALAREPVPIYGDGRNIRDWVYVLDHCKGIDLVFHQGKSGESYNIGGRNERENLTIARIICEMLDRLAVEGKKDSKIGSYAELITFVNDRPGHDWRYAIDAGKMEKQLGWKAQEDFESGIIKTVQWYLKHYQTHQC